MSKLQSIMVVMSLQRRATPALHRATAYARRSGAVLHLYLFDYYAPIDCSRAIFGVEVAERARRDFLEECMKWLSELASGLAAQGLRVECDAIWAPSLHRAIIGKILEVQPDLVIKDIDCLPSAGFELHPSGLDWKLLRLCPASMMLVHPASKLLPCRICASVDVIVMGREGELNERVVEAAQFYAILSDADLHIASVFRYAPLTTYGSGFIADTYEIMDADHKEALAKFASRHHITSKQVLRCIAIDPAEGIANCVRTCGADLVVLGSAFHSGFERLMFGTTAESLLGKLACDALLVKPNGFKGEITRLLRLSDQDMERLATRSEAA